MEMASPNGPEPQQFGARHLGANGNTHEKDVVDTDEVCLTLGGDDNDAPDLTPGRKGNGKGKPGEENSGRSRVDGAAEDAGGSGNWWKQAFAEHNSRHRSGSRPPDGDAETPNSRPPRQASAAAAAYAGTGAVATRGRSLQQDKASEFAVIRLHMFFDDQVKRLEFEVEWAEVQPAAGIVKPGGEAERRGLVCGDRIVEIGGTQTSGKGREELLPALKGRPLMIKVDRNAQMRDPQEPHVELKLPFNIGTYDNHGIEFTWCGQLPVATKVQPHSKAWAAGMLEGDGLVRLNGRDVTKLSKGALASALSESPQTVTVWRRPRGMDMSTPWTRQV